MKGGSKLFLIAGIGLAVVAVAIFVMGMSGDDKKADATQQEASVEQVSIVQAAVPIPAHRLLLATDLLVVRVPVTDAPADAIKSTGEVLNMSYRIPLAQGQTLLKAQVEQPGIRNDIQVGKRALSLPADDVSMLSGLIQDGDYVDVVFKTRINLIRVLPTNFAETAEDTPPQSYGIAEGGASGNGTDGEGASGGQETTSSLTQSEAGPILWVASGFEVDNETHPYAGDPGSKFAILDSAGELEKVAKVLVQDVKVLRVVRPGESYAASGTLAGQSAAAEAAAPAEEAAQGHLILEVSPAQAEALAFIQDPENQHTYQVVVRGQDDHEQVETSGITFEILASDEEWSLPWPQSIQSPEEDAVIADESGDSIDDLVATPTADATPEASGS
jgi:Flp pilus assembly protein CpaB